MCFAAFSSRSQLRKRHLGGDHQRGSHAARPATNARQVGGGGRRRRTIWSTPASRRQRSGLAANGADWTSVRALLAAPADCLAALGEAAEALLAEAHPRRCQAVADARLGPPVPDPQKILCVGLNYARTPREARLDEPSVPLIFAKFPNVLIGSGAPIELPESHGRQVDYEGEIAVVIGRRVYRLSEADALDAVAGGCPSTTSARVTCRPRHPNGRSGKSPDTFRPVRVPTGYSTTPSS